MKTKIFILGCVLLWSCSKTNELPEGVLTQEQMAEILVEVYYAQAKVSNAKLKKDSSEILYEYYQNYLLEKNETDTTAFYKSLTYYLDNPVEFDKINESVLDTLNFRLQKLEAQEEKNRKNKQTELVK